MSERHRRLAGALLLAGLVLLAWLKSRSGLLPEMLWICHVSGALMALGLLAGRPLLSAMGFLCHLAVGLPYYLLDLALGGQTHPVSLALHLLTPALGWMAWRGRPLPRPTTWCLLGLHALLVGLSHAFTPEALNINLAFQPSPPGQSLTLWTWQAFRLPVLGLQFAAVQWAWNRMAAWPRRATMRAAMDVPEREPCP